jgi:hypothetical protein
VLTILTLMNQANNIQKKKFQRNGNHLLRNQCWLEVWNS